MTEPSVAILGTRGYPSFYGGFETAVRHLAPYLAERGWDVTVYGRRGEVDFDDPHRDARVRSTITWGVETSKLSTLTYGFSSMRDAVRSRPDVLLVMNVANGFWLPLARRTGIPTLVNVDGMEWEREKWGRVARSTFRAGARMTAKYADEIVVDSREISRRWSDEFGRKGVFIPYGGQEDPELPPEEGLESGAYVLAVARLVPENSIREFLEAAEHLAERHQVVLVGRGVAALEDQARALSARTPSFRWLGAINDDRRLHSLWQHAGVYFHGHTVGGTNPALVQAMTSGAPVVARDTPYNSEVLGGDATLVADAPDEIAEAIDRLMSDAEQRSRLRVSGWERARTHYTWPSVCESYETALRDLID